MSTPFCLRWGIIATGRIAESFAKDLILDPTARGVQDVRHSLVGVASSRSEDSARGFLSKIGAPSLCRAHGNYEALVTDPDVDVVYIATPHSHHFPNAMLCLEAGKHVVCEKAFTVNAKQAQKLFDTARERNLFLMEGMWTRFLPVGVKVRQLVRDGAIGPVTRIFADNSLGMHPKNDLPPDDRLVRRELAGGALLDLGVYSIHWIFQALQTTVLQPTVISSLVVPLKDHQVDETTTIIMSFRREDTETSSPSTHAIATCSLRTEGNPGGQTPAIRIQGDQGEIQIYGPVWRPSKYCVIKREPGFGNVGESTEFTCETEGGAYGLCYEADEAARCIRDGLIESSTMPWTLTLQVMEVMDTARKSAGLEFLADIESANYPN
ncbi:oxidoreductase [Aulographum hederae CBS 113979]|uniref:D-xylose 1-dehydrogenase (NADP(+), D-xylono-1,5-lactone-forming) n=1 Tax=Aulographum hederae CBS 113979 TaxID=1176131 RepID=A0A6G1GZW6_9PEZI|nr:oxidoreductase [Aulographum hederae CBS 113979]